MTQYDINDLLRIIGIKELTIIQLQLENLRLRQEVENLKCQTQGTSPGSPGTKLPVEGQAVDPLRRVVG